MWILFKLIIAICGFFVRKIALKARSGKQFASSHEGLNYTILPVKKQWGAPKELVRFAAKGPLQHIYFRLTIERRIDRFFKWIGFSQEFQTGFSDFDSRIYIASDHSFFQRALQNDASLRNDILFAFNNGIKSILCTGQDVCFANYNESVKADSPLFQAMGRITKNLEAGLTNLPSKYADIFAWKVLLVESLMCVFMFHTFGVAGELLFNPQESILFPKQLFLPVAAISAFLFLLLFFGARLFIGASSRAHRIFLEIGFILIFTLPVSTANALTDINIHLDRPENLRSYLVKDYSTTQERRRKRRGGSRISYYLHTRIPELSHEPLKIRLEGNTYYGLQSQQPFYIKIGPGYLSYPWIEGYYQVKK